MNEIKYDEVNDTKDKSSFYKLAWRWHFYSGLFVTPFLLILAMTGMAMMFLGYFDGRDGENISVPIPKNPIIMSLDKQSKIALASQKNATVLEWIKGPQENRANVFRLKKADKSQIMIAINPYTGEIIEDWNRRQGWYDFADEVHSDLLLGKTGDRILEIAAGFSIILLITGLYLWWPRNKSIRSALLPNLSAKGRQLFKELHMSVGVYVSVFFLLFLLSGMSWTGIWGAKIMQAWNTFPAQKWNDVPLSHKTHASLNNTVSEGMPWALEQTKLPMSGSKAGTKGILEDKNVNLNSIEKLAQRIGFHGRYRVSFPKGDDGVWTINQDSMSADSTNPFEDKTVHIDQYTGNVLAHVSFNDYSLAGKAMAVSIPLHMGLVSVWNLVINTLVCLSIIFLLLTGIILWWKRRPSNSGFKLCPPSIPSHIPHWKNAMIIMLALSLFFPLVGLTLIVVLTLDVLIISKVSFLKNIFK